MPPPTKSTAAEARALERARDLPNTRTATDVDSLRRSFLDHLQFSQGKDEHSATALDRYFALAYSVRDRLMRRWIQTQQAYYRTDAKRVYYLSLEFLMGKALENNLINLGLYDGERVANAVVQAQVDEVVLERLPHEELEREIVDALRVGPVVGLLRLDPAPHQAVADAVSERKVAVERGGGVLVLALREL